MLSRSVKPRICANCGKEFVPFQSMQKVCPTVKCARGYVKKLNAVRVKEWRDRREKLKSPRDLEQECRRIVQAIARLRDRNDGCISCEKGPHWHGQWHGSHFRSVGACSALSLHLWNIHKACSVCNHHKSGNIAEYEPRLLLKLGRERVDWLKSRNQVVRRDRDYLLRFKQVMGKRLRRLQKRYA
jgi:hypothetical protein